MCLTELMKGKENTSLNFFIFCMLNIYKSCLNEIKDKIFLQLLVNVAWSEVRKSIPFLFIDNTIHIYFSG